RISSRSNSAMLAKILATKRPNSDGWATDCFCGRPGGTRWRAAGRQRGEHIRASERAEALPDVRPIQVSSDQLREVSGRQIDMHRGENQRGDGVQHKRG